MNLAEALLATDAGRITKLDTKEFEIPRLTKLIGAPFILHLKEIPPKRVREIQDASTKIEDNSVSADTYKLYMGLLCAGITDRDFDNKEVLKHYGAATRADLFSKMFTAGEIQDIAQEISDMCGFGKKSTKAVEDVKN